MGMIKKDKFKRYASDNLSSSEGSKKILSIMDYNIQILASFIAQCLETYTKKN